MYTPFRMGTSGRRVLPEAPLRYEMTLNEDTSHHLLNSKMAVTHPIGPPVQSCESRRTAFVDAHEVTDEACVEVPLQCKLGKGFSRFSFQM